MKLKSELYISELNMILFGLTLQMQDIVKVLQREKRKAQVACFFAPWLSREIYTTLAVKADYMMKHVAALSELRDKIMQAEGIDDDMQTITFEQICEQAVQENA